MNGEYLKFRPEALEACLQGCFAVTKCAAVHWRAKADTNVCSIPTFFPMTDMRKTKWVFFCFCLFAVVVLFCFFGVAGHAETKAKHPPYPHPLTLSPSPPLSLSLSLSLSRSLSLSLSLPLSLSLSSFTLALRFVLFRPWGSPFTD